MFQLAKQILIEGPGFLFDLTINIPFMHCVALYQSPKDIFAILVIGPIAGLISFLTNPKSLAFGLVTSLVATFLLPAVSFMPAIAIGVGISFLTSTVESLVVRTQNRIEFDKIYWAEQGEVVVAMGQYYGRKELVEAVFPRSDQAPTGLGPMSKAIYHDFQWANSTSFTKPYITYSDTHHIPENLGGLRPH